MTGPNHEPDAEPAPIEAFEERPEVVDAIEDDVTVPGLPIPDRADDHDTPEFQPPEQEGRNRSGLR